MTEIALVVLPPDELRRLIIEAVQSAFAGNSANGEWVDARSSGVGYRVFLRLAREGAFPVSRRGKKYIARRADIDAYLERQRVQPAPAPLTQSATLPGPMHDPIAAALAQGRLRIVKKSP